MIAAIGRELAEEDQTEVPGTPLIDPETPRLEDEEMDPLAGLRSSIRRQSPKKNEAIERMLHQVHPQLLPDHQ